MKSAVETGTPFIFFRDTVNEANPNKHAGMIYASNLCHEIAQNVGFTNLKKEILEDDGTITTVTAPGDMVTCNLNSINLGKIDEDFLEEQIALQVRMLDNVITINQTPVPESRLTCDKYRAIGLGTSGYHHYLVKHGLRWESKEHIAAADALFEKIAYYAIKASMELSKERGLILPSRDLNGIRANTLPGAAIPVKNGSVLLPTSTSTVCAMGISLLWRQPVQRATLPIQRLASILFSRNSS